MNKPGTLTALLGATLNVISCSGRQEMPLQPTRDEISAVVRGLNAVKDGPQPDGSVIVCTSGRTPEIAASGNQDEAKKALGVHAYQVMCGQTPLQEDQRAYTGGEEKRMVKTESENGFTIVCRRMAPPVQVLCKDGQVKEYKGK